MNSIALPLLHAGVASSSDAWRLDLPVLAAATALAVASLVVGALRRSPGVRRHALRAATRALPGAVRVAVVLAVLQFVFPIDHVAGVVSADDAAAHAEHCHGAAASCSGAAPDEAPAIASPQTAAPIVASSALPQPVPSAHRAVGVVVAPGTPPPKPSSL